MSFSGRKECGNGEWLSRSEKMSFGGQGECSSDEWLTGDEK